MQIQNPNQLDKLIQSLERKDILTKEGEFIEYKTKHKPEIQFVKCVSCGVVGNFKPVEGSRFPYYVWNCPDCYLGKTKYKGQNGTGEQITFHEFYNFKTGSQEIDDENLRKRQEWLKYMDQNCE